MRFRLYLRARFMRRIAYISLKCLVLAGAVVVRYFLPWEPPTPTSRNLIYTSLRLIMVVLVLNLAYHVVKAIYLARTKTQGRDAHDGFTDGLRNIFIIASGLAVGGTVFGFFGIDFKTLFTTLSIVAAAIAIVTKEFLHDLLIGIFLGFSRDYEIGDYVKIAEEKGKIVEIGLLKLKLLNDDDDVLIIPNSKVYSSEVTNFTKRDMGLMSIDFQISLAKIKGIDELENELIQSLETYKEFIYDDSFLLKIVEVKKEHLDLKFQYRLKNLDREMQRQIRRKTVRQVLSYILEKPNLEKVEKA